MASTLPRYRRRFVITLIAIGVALAPLLWGARQATLRIYNSPPEWVPESFPQRRIYEQFIRDFEGDDTIVISWTGCTVDDPRLRDLEEALTSPRDPQERSLHEKLYLRVFTGYSVLRDLTREAGSRREALDRLRGALVGPDGKTSCAVVLPTLYAAYNREEAIGHLLDVAERVVGVPRDEFYLAGPPVDGWIIDTESVRSLDHFALPSALATLLLAWGFLRSWRFTLVVIAVATFGEILVLALTHFSGQTLNAVLIVVPSLVFVLTVSAGVHLVNYFYDQVRLGAQDDAPRRAMAAGWLPCVLAAVTTAIGLASLMVSEVSPIRVFSVISVIGVLGTVGVLFLLLPGTMELWPIRRRSDPSAIDAEANPLGGVLPVHRPSTDQPRDGTGRAIDVGFGAASPRDAGGWAARMAAVVCRCPNLIVIGCVVLMLASASSLRWMHTSVNIRGLFVSESRIVRDYRWLEENLGPLVPVEVVLNFTAECQLDTLQRLELVQHVQDEIARIDELDGVTSAASFTPPIPFNRPPVPTRGILARTRYRRQLDDQLDSLVQLKYLHLSDGRQSWRISARVPALAEIDYGHFLGDLRRQVDPILIGQREQGVNGIHATYTGVMPLVDEAQRALLHDLFASFLTAFAVVAVVMMLVLRSVPAGLLAMLPNAFPTILVFGVLSWRGVPVDIGSVMSASVALGIAVDGTLHFLIWYRRETSAGRTPSEAVRNCYQHCGKALAQATIICGLGLLVFGLSQFVPTRRFAWMMLSLLVAALAGDLLLLPALLVSPLGRVFAGRPNDQGVELSAALPADSPSARRVMVNHQSEPVLGQDFDS